MRGLHVCFGGPDRRIRVGEITFVFEMHSYFGPVPMTDDGMSSRELPEKSPFWRAVTLWDRQGQKLDEHGVCVWRDPSPERVRHLGGRRYVIVQASDDHEMCLETEVVDEAGNVVRTFRRPSRS